VPSLEVVPLSLYVCVPSLVELCDRTGDKVFELSVELEVCVGSTLSGSLGGVVGSYAVLYVEAEKDDAREAEDNLDLRLGRNALGRVDKSPDV
jgi:hypothetical protein